MRSTLTTAALAAALLVPVTPASAQPVELVDIKVLGTATISPDDTGVYAGTTIHIPVRVRCPLGSTAYAPFAGLPGFFPDGSFAQPYLPGHTSPTRFTCTGRPQTGHIIARSIARLQNPETHPFRYFTKERVTVVAQLSVDEVIATDTKTVQIR